MEVDRETGEILTEERPRSPFQRDDIPEETKQAWRRYGGSVGGRKRKYLASSEFPLPETDDDLQLVRAALRRQITVLENMDSTPAVCNAMSQTLKLLWLISVEATEREKLWGELQELQAAMGLSNA